MKLTDEQIDAVTHAQWGGASWPPNAAFRAYARAIEAELEKQAAGSEVEIAGLTSSVGHLSALVDEVRGLLRRAIDAMGALHAAAEPDENLAAVIPYEAFHAFVDEHAALLRERKNGAAAETEKQAAGWISVEERLPEPGAIVFVACGKHVLRAMHAPHLTLTEDAWGEFLPDGGEYDEATDATYWPEGWYENNQHEETHWMLDDEPTHWMLPPAPPSPSGTTEGGE